MEKENSTDESDFIENEIPDSRVDYLEIFNPG